MHLHAWWLLGVSTFAERCCGGSMPCGVVLDSFLSFPLGPRDVNRSEAEPPPSSGLSLVQEEGICFTGPSCLRVR